MDNVLRNDSLLRTPSMAQSLTFPFAEQPLSTPPNVQFEPTRTHEKHGTQSIVIVWGHTDSKALRLHITARGFWRFRGFSDDVCALVTPTRFELVLPA